jgi:hypothetical protein
MSLVDAAAYVCSTLQVYVPAALFAWGLVLHVRLVYELLVHDAPRQSLPHSA